LFTVIASLDSDYSKQKDKLTKFLKKCLQSKLNIIN